MRLIFPSHRSTRYSSYSWWVLTMCQNCCQLSKQLIPQNSSVWRRLGGTRGCDQASHDDISVLSLIKNLKTTLRPSHHPRVSLERTHSPVLASFFNANQTRGLCLVIRVSDKYTRVQGGFCTPWKPAKQTFKLSDSKCTQLQTPIEYF